MSTKGLMGVIGGCLLFVAVGVVSAEQSDNKGSGPLTIEAVVQSVMKHHPELKAALSLEEVALWEQAESNAVFDPAITQETFVRTDGYYDGQYAEQSVRKALGPMNAEVFGTYRISDGAFPVYESAYETLNGGEVAMGLKLSLLKDRDTDARRTEILNADLLVQQARSRRELSQNYLIYSAVSAYLDWFMAARKVDILRELVKLNESRVSAIEARVSRGDLPRINLTEVESSLLSRQVALQQAAQSLQLAEVKLRYFVRDDDGGVRAVLPEAPDGKLQWPYAQFDTDVGVQNYLEQHPKALAIKAKLAEAENKYRLAVNETRPELDVEFKVARDLGDGIERLSGTDTMVGLTFELPLGQRAAKAKQRQRQSQVRALEHELRSVEDQLRRDIDMATLAVETSKELLSVSEARADMAEALFQQEQVRFGAGVSDLFVLINRESAYFQAQLDLLASQLDVAKRELNLLASLAVLDQLG